MSMSIDIAKKLAKLNKTMHENAKEYYHSRPIASSETNIILPDKTRYHFKIEYDLKDLFTIAAITHSSMLLTGGTDTGKTALSKLAMNAFFGLEDQGWHRIDVDNDFGKDTYTDVDFGNISDGKKMSEGLYDAQPWLMLPGLIADEINRAPPKVQSALLEA